MAPEALGFDDDEDLANEHSTAGIKRSSIQAN